MSVIQATNELIDTVAARLPAIIEAAGGYHEVFDVDLSRQPLHPPGRLVVAKFLRGRDLDVERTCKALEETLRWRKEFNPISAAFEEDFGDQFDGIAYITQHGDDIVCWTLFGEQRCSSRDVRDLTVTTSGLAAKDTKRYFTPLDKYVRWRVGIQERTVAATNINDYEGDGTVDTKMAIMVSDFTDVSMWKLDSPTRAASQAIVQPTTGNYLEVVKKSYFLSTPLFLRALLQVFKMFLSQALLDKFALLGGRTDMGAASGLQDSLPKQYGGTSNKTLDDLALPRQPPPKAASAANGHVKETNGDMKTPSVVTRADEAASTTIDTTAVQA